MEDFSHGGIYVFNRLVMFTGGFLEVREELGLE
jgi:hypothetical protein